MCGASWVQIIAGAAAAIAGLLLASYSFALARRNPIFWLSGVGAVVFVAGLVGQRAYYLTGPQSSAGCSKTVSQHPGIWDASLGIPLTSIYLDAISVVGLIAVILAGCLTLFFERVGADSPPDLPELEPLEARDAV